MKKRKLKLKKHLIWGLVKFLIKNTAYMLVGSIYILYIVIKFINDLAANAFMCLPRILKVSIIYTLVLTPVIFYNYPKTIVKEVEKIKVIKIVQALETKEEKPKKEKVEVAKESDENSCKLSKEIECTIYNRGIKKGLTNEQALMVVAISKHETGNWTSNAYKNKHNFGGIMCSSGLKNYSSFDEGLNAFINLLKNHYFDKGLTSVKKIGAKYCPVGAKNDPTGVNKYWVPNVTKYYNEYLKK